MTPIGEDFPSACHRLFAAEWPGVKFTLPPLNTITAPAGSLRLGDEIRLRLEGRYESIRDALE